jgi:nitroreductase
MRKFTDEMPGKEMVEQILRAGMQAPSAKNQQPWEFYVVTDKDMLFKLSEATPWSMCAKNAQIAIVPAYRTSGLEAPEFAQIDMSIAMENIWLETTELGLAGTWLGVAPMDDRMKIVEDIVGIPEGQRAFAIFPFGYPGREKEAQDRFDPDRIHWVNE